MSGESLQLRGEVPTSKRSDARDARTDEDVVTGDGFLSGYRNVRRRCPARLLPWKISGRLPCSEGKDYF